MLELKNVIKVYRPKRGLPVIALNKVNLKIQDKGMVFILGKSGSGKSTLLNVLGGLDKYDDGEIIIKGKSSKDFSQSDFDSYRNTYVGFIFQEYNILDEFTVGANIALAIELQGRKATESEINSILEEVDLVGYGNRKPNELSGGQKQRVAIARALVKNPEIILADEPTGALDSKTGIQVFDTLKKLSKNKLVLVVSHDREFAEDFGDRVIELADGVVVSDIQKYRTEVTESKEGINVVEDKLIHITKGYQLVESDLKMINEYLAKINDEAFISIDKEASASLRKFVKSDFNGHSEEFRATDYSTLDFKSFSKNDFSLIRSRLPLKNSLRMGASGLKNKPIRLVFTILLSLVAFTMFGLSDTLGSYNKINTAIRSIQDTDVQNISFQKRINYYEEEYDYWYEDNAPMNDDDIDFLNEKMEELGLDTRFAPVYGSGFYGGVSYSFHNNILRPENLGALYESYYSSGFSGFAEFSEADITSLGYEVIGSLPDTDTEIAISSYIYDHFKTAGYRNQFENITIEPEGIQSEQDLIGKELDLNGMLFTVTGVINTELSSKYDVLKEEQNLRETDVGYWLLWSEYQAVIQYGFHSIAFVKPGFIQNTFSNPDRLGISLSENQGYLRYYGNTVDNFFEIQAENVVKASDIDSDSIIFFENGKTKLDDGDILVFPLIPLSNMMVDEEDLPSGYGELYLINYMDEKYYDAAYKYAEENYEEAYSNGFGGPSTGDGFKLSNFLNFLTYDGFMENPYTDKSGFDIMWETWRPIIEKYISEMEETELEKYMELPGSGYKNKYDISKVAGIFIPSKEMYSFYGTFSNYVVIDDNFYNFINTNSRRSYGFAIGQMPKSSGDLRKLVEFYYTYSENNTTYLAKNAVSSMLEQVESMIEGMAQVFLIISIVFAVFSSLLLMNFIGTSISHKKREIGILRAVGARSADVFGIFYNESLIIALINYVLSSIATIIFVIVLNNVLRNEVGLVITVLNYGLRQIILMLAICIGVATIASFLPVYKIARKKPIDAINNR